MQLLKSLFCQQGFDNRDRFTLINVTCYLLFIILSVIFQQLASLSVMLLILLATINGLSTLRRLNDAQLNKTWAVVPPLAFFICGLLVIFLAFNGVHWLMVMPVAASCLLLTYPAKNNRQYTLGYNGPVNMSEYDQQKQVKKHASRIEPTLTGSSNQSFDTPIFQAESEPLQSFNEPEYAAHANNKSDLGENLRLQLLKNKNSVFVIFGIIGLMFIAIMINVMGSFFEPKVTLETPIVATPPNIEKSHSVSLPDNFSVMLSQHDGVIIEWQGESQLSNNVWSLAKAEGDKSCQVITFNNGDKLRPLNVFNESGDIFYAVFSPLDTNTLINNIVFRGKFELCGYEFSLKGSQAALGKHPIYADIINY